MISSLLDRRRFLKYAGATAAVAGASAIGLDLLPKYLPSQQETTTAGIHQGPTINNLTWTPTRVVNGKVYDGTISFEADDPSSPVVQAQLQFNPVYPPEIPVAAMPHETDQNFALPANSKSATFSQTISELKGGKQYRASARARDQYGGEGESSIVDIPYVREFENISSKYNLTINAHYMPFLEPGTWSAYWNDGNETPLLGRYNSADEFVVDRHIDWASGFGMKSFSLDWAGQNGYANYNIKAMLANPLMKDMDFFILLDTAPFLGVDGPWNIDNPAIRRQLLDGTEYLVQNFLTHPSYLKIQGAKPIYYWASISWKGDVLSLTNDLRKVAKNYGIDLYVIGDPVGFYEPSKDRVVPFDAITEWANYDQRNGDTRHILQSITNNYQKWAGYAKSDNVSFIPSAMPGFRKPSQLQSFATVPRDIDFFKSQLEIGRDYIDPLIRMLFVTTFNDWTENTGVEPTVNENFVYLQAIRDTLAG